MVPKVFYKELDESKEVLISIKEDIEDSRITFELAAKKYSDDESTKYNGGFLVNEKKTGEYKFYLDEIDSSIKSKLLSLEIGQDFWNLFLSLLMVKKVIE